MEKAGGMQRTDKAIYRKDRELEFQYNKKVKRWITQMYQRKTE